MVYGAMALLSYIITIVSNYVLHCFWLVLVVVCTTIQCFCLLKVFWCPCMAIDVSVQYNGGFFPYILLLTQCYYHRGTRLNAMNMFLSLQLMIPPKRFDIFPPVWDTQKV